AGPPLCTARPPSRPQRPLRPQRSGGPYARAALTAPTSLLPLRADAQLLLQLSTRADDEVAYTIAQRADVLERHTRRLDRLQHPHLRVRTTEQERALGHAVTGTGDCHRQDRRARLDGYTERAIAEWQQLRRLRARALRHDHHRDPLRQPVAHLAQRRRTTARFAATDRDVARKAHHPAHERDVEDLLLRHPLHLPWQMADEEDVGVGLVVGNRDVGPARIRDTHARRPEPPEGIHPHRDNCG